MTRRAVCPMCLIAQSAAGPGSEPAKVAVAFAIGFARGIEGTHIERMVSAICPIHLSVWKEVQKELDTFPVDIEVD